MAFDAYLEIDGIPGESTDSNHAGWIEIRGYTHNIIQPVAASKSSGGSRASEKANHGDLVVTKELDKASPKIALACCNGSNLATVKLELCRATGNKETYMSIELTDVLVAAYEPHGQTADEGALPRERVAFNYGTIKWTYTHLDQATGASQGNIETSWNQIDNTGG